MKTLLVALCLCGLALALAAEEAGVWLDVPFVKQDKDGCGAASIAMVMQYWQKQQGSAVAEADSATIQRSLYSQKGRGIYASDLEHYFQLQGFRAFAFQGSWEDLKEHLQKGRPLIVALKPVAHSADLHYVVIAGLDWEHNIVMMNDPAERKLLKQERSKFEKQWSGAGNWTLLAVPQANPAEPAAHANH